ncbi:hypothetical protein [Geothrix edaphica]|uniref:Uncharacterized protein n=1 Tax=Geothrix edaphica TaxID=2927976 RepID=A0ABQ5PWN3_9BACT|nr:hypothetical protein [Geothrix edaphica]GLH66589.1 hypothetical protein GETHED_09530 [Geothrix edaphica]
MTRPALRWTIPCLLAAQLLMLWLQGAQLHRQNQVLQGLREDLQALTESLDANQGPVSGSDDTEAVPASTPPKAQARSHEHVAVLGIQEEQEAGAKDLQASRESAQKAVKDAREAQSKISIEENARKAEETRKVQAATSSWMNWSWGAVGLVAAALVARAVIRRRG